MNILKLLYKLRFNNQGEIDTQKAIHDGGGYYTVDDFIMLMKADGDAFDEVSLKGYEIIDEDSGEVLYEVISGKWDDNGKFWRY